MFENDNELVGNARNFWANYIETGKITSSLDAFNQGLPYTALDLEQIKFVVRLRESAKKVLSNPNFKL